MRSDPHARARALLNRALVTGVTADEQRWLDEHLSSCAECEQCAELSRRAIQALGHFAFELDPEAVRRVQATVRRRADVLTAAEADRRALAVALGLTIAGSLAMWEVGAWVGARWNLSAPAWQAAFAVLWLAPSLALMLVLAFRRRLAV